MPRAQDGPRGVSVNTNDALTFFRSRVATVARMSGIFTLAFLATAPVLESSSKGVGALAGSLDPARLVTAAIGAFLIAVAFLVKRAHLARVTLEALDAVLTLIACVGFDVTILGADPAERQELVVALIATNVLLGRAAILPSSGRRTALVGVLAVVPLVVTTYVAYGGVRDASLAWSRTGSVSQWETIAIIASALVSRRLYAMQRQIDAAQRFGQYVLEQKIGEGGMGEVFRARHALLRRPTALKLLPRARAGEQAIARFEREVQLTSRLTQPSTIQIYDFGRAEDGTFYYAMELVEGLNLEELVLRDGGQPPGRVARILADVCASLAEAHEAGLVHRDIKPQNVMLCARGGSFDVVKVLDFGLVKTVDEATQGGRGSHTLAGTPAYMAPEAIADPGRFGSSSDLYAVGALGYFLLTGAPVFGGGGAFEVLGQHLHSPPLPPSQRSGRPVPPALERVVLSCLAKAPADRPASARVLREELLAQRDRAPWSDADAARWWRDYAESAGERGPTSSQEERPLRIRTQARPS